MADHAIELLTRNDSFEIKRITAIAAGDRIVSAISAEDDTDDASAKFNFHSVQGGDGSDTLLTEISARANSGNEAETLLNVSLVWGDDGSDVITGRILGLAFDGLATSRGNSQSIDGGAAADEIYADVASFAGAGTALAGQNATLVRGGSGDDIISAGLSSWAVGGGAVTRDNLMTIEGGAGKDELSLRFWAIANAGGRATLVDNIAALSGGDGADRLRVIFQPPDVSTGITIGGNRVVLNGGSGNDILSYSGGGLRGNTVVLFGGAGSDTAEIDMRMETADLTFYFSEGYDRSLPDGTRLFGIEAMRVTGGDGDDVFQGGTGNDRFDGSLGFDQVILKGAASDYDITTARGGWTRVTDLRPEMPGDSDLFINVDSFVFGGGGLDLV